MNNVFRRGIPVYDIYDIETYIFTVTVFTKQAKYD